MTAAQPLSYLLRLSPAKIQKEKLRFFEAQITAHIVKRLQDAFRARYTTWLQITHTKMEEGYTMIDTRFLQNIIVDIVSAGDYTLEGIAHYTGLPQDIIYDVATGICEHPSLFLFQKLIELHVMSKKDLYEKIRNEILAPD